MELFRGCSEHTLANGLRWLREPPSWRFRDGSLEVTPAARTDFFRPYRGEPHDDACLLCVPVRGDFTAVTEAKAELVGFGDAAALTVRAAPDLWAKLCVERSPTGEVAIVSVVTRGSSDDANNELLSRAAPKIRITRSGNVFGMHYSIDGRRWRFVRTFGLDMPEEVMVGVHAQAPFVGGCRAFFSSLTIEPGAVKDFRSGD